IYENLSTHDALPRARETARQGTNLGEDARETIQQVYNNLASNVSVSEVYIVPADLDPDRIDPVTGKPEEPILMFDQLIVNAGGRARQQTGKYLPSSANDLPPEVEIYEYRQFHDQFRWLKEHYPDLDGINGLDVPMSAARRSSPATTPPSSTPAKMPTAWACCFRSPSTDPTESSKEALPASSAAMRLVSYCPNT